MVVRASGSASASASCGAVVALCWSDGGTTVLAVVRGPDGPMVVVGRGGSMGWSGGIRYAHTFPLLVAAQRSWKQSHAVVPVIQLWWERSGPISLPGFKAQRTNEQTNIHSNIVTELNCQTLTLSVIEVAIKPSSGGL